jgi:uncharacterized membrane protein YecN with MAPEG domain
MSFPITGLYAGLLGVLLIVLSLWVIYLRLTLKVGIGAGESRVLLRVIRVHGNFTEYIPHCLILLALNEAGGASPGFLHATGATIFVSRLLHALGLGRFHGVSIPRFVGTAATQTVLFLLSSRLIWAYLA